MKPGLEDLRFLLLQARDVDDPMISHEIDCFARTLGCDRTRISTFDLMSACPTPAELHAVDIVLLGGSGDYSVVEGGPWLDAALEAMVEIHDLGIPTFASCWGFQAMARALGGEVVNDRSRAEVGTHQVWLTKQGMEDPVFGPMPPAFDAQMGHEDIVDRLPDGAVLLASTDGVPNQAYTFRDKPIYCTQFHPELELDTLLDRLVNYPRYLEEIMGVTFDGFVKGCRQSPETSAILTRFVRHVARDLDR